jgi:hypothetical protein
MTRLSERGLTLTEVTIVTVLASLVMLGLVGFYMSSQATWMDASAQAITQREATALMESITRHVHEAASAVVTETSGQARLELFDHGSNPTYAFWWNSSDSLIHEGSSAIDDRGPAIGSKVERFQCVGSGELVQVTLRLRSAQRQIIELTSTAELVNREPTAGP